MATELHDVQPGDLIKAEYFNAIVAALADLDARVAELEGQVPSSGSNEVVIESVSPRTVRMGEALTVTGRNFGWTTGATVVFLGEHLITAFTSGSNTELVFTIPDLPAFPATGLPVQLAVSSAIDTDTDTINVLPRAVSPAGDVSISYVGTDPATPTAGELLLIEYELLSHASATVEVGLTPVISTGWSPVRILSGAPPQPLPLNQISLSRLERKTVFVEVTIPSSATTGVLFNVELRGAAAGIVVATASRDFAVGTAAPQEDETIELSAPDGTEISVGAGETHLFEIACTFSETGSYLLTTELDPSDAAWTIDTSDVPTPIEIVDTSGVGGIVSVTLGVTRQVGGITPQPTTLVIEVRKIGRITSRTLLVELTAT
jgi:hypothetical protein